MKYLRVHSYVTELGMIEMARSVTTENARSIFNRLRHGFTNYDRAWRQAEAAGNWSPFSRSTYLYFKGLAPNNKAWTRECKRWRQEHL
jgi:hypothetical protein